MTSVTKTLEFCMVGMSVSGRKRSPHKDQAESCVLNVHALNEMLLLVYLSAECIYIYMCVYIYCLKGYG